MNEENLNEGVDGLKQDMDRFQDKLNDDLNEQDEMSGTLQRSERMSNDSNMIEEL